MLVSKISKTIDSNSILDNVSFSLNNKDKVALVGINGAGKSTLLKILNNDEFKDSGTINYNNETISLLRQEIPLEFYDYSIYDFIKYDSKIFELENKIHEFESNLTEENMGEYGHLIDIFLKLDGYNFETNLSIILNGLNLKEEYNKQIKKLSGGEKIKVLLASLLLKNSDILLLDEPTNNLDIEAIEWLENYLKHSKCKMIIVSHDEEFIDNITNKIFELENGKIIEYNLTYSEYLSYKDTLYKHDLEEYENIEIQKKKLKSAIQESKQWANKGLNNKKSDNDKLSANFSKERTKKTSSKVAQLNKVFSKLDVDTDFRKKEEINFDLNYIDSKGNKNILIDDLVCGYEDFKTPPISINIPFGTRVQISGSNGSGKTTFIKTIINEIKSISGSVNIGNEAKIGYISQNSFDTIKNDFSIIDYLSLNNDISNGQLFTILDKFNIKYEDKDKKYSILSPGQRTRVNLAKLAIDQINILVLDEATNHLDLEAVNILKEVVKNFNGTIIYISHNRKFTREINCDIILNIETGQITYSNSPRLIKSI